MLSSLSLPIIASWLTKTKKKRRETKVKRHHRWRGLSLLAGSVTHVANSACIQKAVLLAPWRMTQSGREVSRGDKGQGKGEQEVTGETPRAWN